MSENWIVMIKKNKEKIQLKEAVEIKWKIEKFYVVLWRPTHSFIFTVTAMSRMEGEINFFKIK